MRHHDLPDQAVGNGRSAPGPPNDTELEPDTDQTPRPPMDSRSTSSSGSPTPAEREEQEYDLYFGLNDSQSSLPVPNLKDMHVVDEYLPPVHCLPNEILIAIFSRLGTTTDLLHVMLTCKRWARNVVDLLWHRPACTTWERHSSICRTLGLENPYFCYRDFVKRLNLTAIAPQINDGSVLPFQDCTRIERLTLAGCRNLTDSGLIPLVENNNHLVSLDISLGDQITEQSIYTVAKHCPRLQGLNISGCTRISNESLIELAQRCRYLKRLKLNECTQVTDKTVLAFAENCPNILEIDLQQCRLVGNEPITAIFTKGRALRELRLVGCEMIDDGAFLALPPNKKYDHLRILDLSSCSRITDRAVEKIIEVAPRIRNVVLQKCRNLTDAAVYAISRLGKNLHFLHLGHCGHITDDGVKRLVSACTRIRYIDLGCCQHLTDESVKLLANLPKLKRVGLVKCTNITDASIIALAEANRRPRVRRDENGNAYTIPGDYTTSYSSLERVHLSYCTNLTLRSIIRLLNYCPRLTHLSLTGVPAFLRRDLAVFSRDAPPEFTQHQREVFCVFSGQGVVNLREYLNSSEVQEMHQFDDMGVSNQAGGPVFTTNPASAQGIPPLLQTADGGFEDGDADAVVDDDDGVDVSEMIIDGQPLPNHQVGLGLNTAAAAASPLPPPPLVPPSGRTNPTPLDYVAESSAAAAAAAAALFPQHFLPPIDQTGPVLVSAPMSSTHQAALTVNDEAVDVSLAMAINSAMNTPIAEEQTAPGAEQHGLSMSAVTSSLPRQNAPRNV